PRLLIVVPPGFRLRRPFGGDYVLPVRAAYDPPGSAGGLADAPAVSGLPSLPAPLVLPAFTHWLPLLLAVNSDVDLTLLRDVAAVHPDALLRHPERRDAVLVQGD